MVEYREDIYRELLLRFEEYKEIGSNTHQIKHTHGILFTTFIFSYLEEKNFSEIFGIGNSEFNRENIKSIHNKILSNILNHNELKGKIDEVKKFFMKETDFVELNKVLYRRNSTICCLNIRYYSIMNKFIIIVAEDITETLEDIFVLDNLLNENKELLKEVHHRVKNNIQVLISLINIQEKFNKSDESINEFLKLSLSSMSVLYGQSYTSNLNEISLKPLIDDLKLNIESIYSDLNIDFDLTCTSDLYLSIDRLNPLLIVINKLILNSVHYAFDKTDLKIIRCTFKKEDNNIIIIYEDNGEKVFDSSKKGFGSFIFDTLIKQADGSIEKINPERYDVKIKLPLNTD